MSKFVVSSSLTYGGGAAAIVALDKLWYKDFERSSFHFKDDISHWQQMDKMGHLYSAYHLSRFGYELMHWSGADDKTKYWLGAGFGFLFLKSVEVLDGHSAEWGFSWSDMLANSFGTGLFVAQQLIWDEQRIIPKFSFSKSGLAPLRPNVLGQSTMEQILKDYNGQTYWLSFGINDFFKTSFLPDWISCSLGYGAYHMIGATSNPDWYAPIPYRSFYLSLDVNLHKIRTESSLLKTFFSIFNTIKIPAPTFEINISGRVKFHYLYF